MTLFAKLSAYAHLARLETPAGWLLLLWPTLWALWHASAGAPSVHNVLIFCGGVFLMRCLGCCVNDIADRRADLQVARTHNRPLAAGRISVAEALVVAAVFGAASFLLWLELSRPAQYWALGALFFAVTYPLSKRWMAVPQIYLGVTYSFGIPVAYAHVTGSVPPLAWLLVAANWFHVMAYDTIYALVDVADDRRAGINSAAVAFGDNVMRIVNSSYLMMLALLLVFGYLAGLEWPFFMAYLLGYGLVWKYVLLARTFEPGRCLQSFRLNHWLGFVVWAALAVSYLVGAE